MSKARVEWQPGHATTARRDAAARRRRAHRLQRSELHQKLAGLRIRGCRWPVEPAKRCGIVDAERRELERKRCEVGFQDLGRRVCDEMVLLVFGPETIAHAR